jgi:Bucentaur or craniofacial development
VSRRPVKRSSNLEALAKGNKPAKLNVLEKSRLDWAGFVDKEGINDELKRYNKDGYIERQEFLKRAR